MLSLTKVTAKANWVFLLFPLLFAILTGCGPKKSEGKNVLEQKIDNWFEDVTESSGLTFTHHAGGTGTYFFPQILGSGAAFLDFDQDGKVDLLDRKSTRLNSSHVSESRMPSSA